MPLELQKARRQLLFRSLQRGQGKGLHEGEEEQKGGRDNDKCEGDGDPGGRDHLTLREKEKQKRQNE